MTSPRAPRPLRHEHGTSPSTVGVIFTRDLETPDLALLRAPAAPASPLARIRDIHHHIAWEIVRGRTYTQIAADFGMTPVRISQLAADPTFRELLATKRAHTEAAQIDATDAMTRMGSESMRRAERLILAQLEDAEATGERIPLRDLSRIAADRMDRFGYGKHSTSTSISVDFAAKLEAAIARSRTPA